ncbi:MAG: hypothetical protein JO138_23445 [Acidobacteriaceae bacterium]|nr:hypothetical protein [Acidobacteriaceae bacterium]
MNRLLRLAVLAGFAAGCLLADVTYNQTVKYTGGTLLDLVHRMANMPMIGRMGGGGMRAAFQDQTFNVFIKGAKMARLGQSLSTIYDLEAGTITTINNEKQTYFVQTFEQLREQTQHMQERMNRGKSGDLQYDIKVEDTGQTRDINGQRAAEMVMTLTAKPESAYAGMVVKVHLWSVEPNEAMKEAVDYQKRLAQKFAYAFGNTSPMFGGAGAGIGAAMKEAMNQKGYPVLNEIELTGLSSPMANNPMMRQGSGDPNAPALQMQTESSNFATGAVDDSKFSVPAGYKEEQPRGMRQ